MSVPVPKKSRAGWLTDRLDQSSEGQKAGVIGSTARGETETNDVDLLVKIDQKISLLDFIGIQQIEEYLDDVNENEFYQNSEKQDAVFRRLEIIGEAVKHNSDDIRDEYVEIPWRRFWSIKWTAVGDFIVDGKEAFIEALKKYGSR